MSYSRKSWCLRAVADGRTTKAAWQGQLVWSHPAIANCSVYRRNDREIRSYSLAAPAR